MRNGHVHIEFCPICEYEMQHCQCVFSGMQSEDEKRNLLEWLKEGSVKKQDATEELSKERKTGKWIYDSEPYPLGNPYGHYGCDQCGESVPARTNFCPNCGAQMIGGDDDV